jgi:DNA-binding transcriptional ArsR family regulator
MLISIDERRSSADSRLTAIRLTLLTLRCMENWKKDVSDYDSAMILVSVVAIGAEKLTRSELEPELRTLERSFPSDRLARCNISSIAAATGLNRETARRKVKSLVEAGLLEKLPGGVITLREGVVQQEATMALVRRQLEAVVRTVNELLRDGVLDAA